MSSIATSKPTIRPPESLHHDKTLPGKNSEIKIAVPSCLPIAGDQKLRPWPASGQTFYGIWHETKIKILSKIKNIKLMLRIESSPINTSYLKSTNWEGSLHFEVVLWAAISSDSSVFFDVTKEGWVGFWPGADKTIGAGLRQPKPEVRGSLRLTDWGSWCTAAELSQISAHEAGRGWMLPTDVAAEEASGTDEFSETLSETDEFSETKGEGGGRWILANRQLRNR